MEFLCCPLILPFISWALFDCPKGEPLWKIEGADSPRDGGRDCKREKDRESEKERKIPEVRYYFSRVQLPQHKCERKRNAKDQFIHSRASSLRQWSEVTLIEYGIPTRTFYFSTVHLLYPTHLLLSRARVLRYPRITLVPSNTRTVWISVTIFVKWMRLPLLSLRFSPPRSPFYFSHASLSLSRFFSLVSTRF